MGNNHVIALWGSPGSGKTLTSVKIARELAELKNNVVLVLCDDETPMVPLVVPSITEAKSLGDLLAQSVVTQINIYQHCIPVGKSISLMGYLLGENENTYADYDKDGAQKFIGLLRHSADYILIDCSHHMLTNTMTAVALESADVVLRVVNSDLKSLIYVKSQRPYLKDPKFKYDQHVTVFNNVRPSQDTNPYEGDLGKSSYILPYLPSLKDQYDAARLLEPLSGREAKLYEPKLQNLVKEVIIGE